MAAIGVRESGFQNRNENDGTGVGVGVFQITVSSQSGVTAAQASNLSWAANYAANLMASNTSTLTKRNLGFNGAQLLQASVAAYNFGAGVKNITGNPSTIDVGTTGTHGSKVGNYGSNVVQLTNCF